MLFCFRNIECQRHYAARRICRKLHFAKFSCRLAQTKPRIHDKIAYRVYKITEIVRSTTYKLAQLHSTKAGFGAALCLCGYLFTSKSSCTHLQKLLKHQLDRKWLHLKTNFQTRIHSYGAHKKTFLAHVEGAFPRECIEIVTNGHQILQFNYTFFSMDLEFHLEDCPSVLPHSLPVSSLIASHGNTTDYPLATVVTLYPPQNCYFLWEGDVHTATSSTVHVVGPTDHYTKCYPISPANFPQFHVQTDQESENNNTHFAS